jgi:hypothetical protein
MPALAWLRQCVLLYSLRVRCFLYSFVRLLPAFCSFKFCDGSMSLGFVGFVDFLSRCILDDLALRMLVEAIMAVASLLYSALSPYRSNHFRPFTQVAS